MQTGKWVAAAVVAGVFAAGGVVAGTEEYTAEGLPFAKKGIPNAEIVFAAGRTAANLAAHGGLSEIRYFGAQAIGEAKLFSGSPISVFNQVFRPYANFGGSEQYFLPFNDTSFWPFGYDSSCRLKGVKFRHRFTVLPDALVWELEAEDGRAAFSLKSALTTCAAPVRRDGRVFKRFAFDGTRGVGSFTEKSGKKEFFASSASSCPTHFAVPINHRKDYFTVPAADGYAAFAVVFGTDEAKTRARAAELDRTARAECAAARAEFCADQAAGTKVRTGHKVLDSFLANAWGNVRSMRVRDLKGGYLASNYCYWIWGWDSMAHCDALGLMGHADDLHDRLSFYRDNATESGDIPHAFDLSGKSTMPMHTAPQTIYTIMLYDYYVFSRDKARTLEFYDFAAKRLDATEKDLVASAGLYKGMSLYPDYPPDLGQTGDDLCSFDNSILFQAFRAMARLAAEFGKDADAKRWTAKADSLKEAFLKRFWDPSHKAFYDSLDAKTLQPRKYYPVYAVLALSPYAWELTEGVEADYARYLLDNHREANGVTMFSRKDPVFYSDGVQLGMYMAVIEREFRRLEAKYGRGESVLPVIERNWRDVEVAEAACMEAVNMNEFTSDAPGKKQQFAINSWYAQTFEVLGGLQFSLDALTVAPSPVDRGGWTVRDLKIGKGTLDVVFTGRGRDVAALALDGQPLEGASVPMSRLLTGRHVLAVSLSSEDRGEPRN